MTLLDPPPFRESTPMPGLEPDNLLAFLALLGLLRALETVRPEWMPRVSWKGPPWIAHLHLTAAVKTDEIAQAAHEGITRVVRHFIVDGRKNVDFSAQEYRNFSRRMRGINPTSTALASALTVESPIKENGDLIAGPLVMMFGQGHQNFLERLIDVPIGKLPSRLMKLKVPPNMGSPAKIANALFQPWQREDDADGFRWDPEEDQRYALRYGNPSRDGAALTEAGANRLAAIGFLSFATVPRTSRMRTAGVVRDAREWVFVWPIWTSLLSRNGIEALLNHPALFENEPEAMRSVGVAQVFRAARIANGKFMNVARAKPM